MVLAAPWSVATVNPLMGAPVRRSVAHTRMFFASVNASSPMVVLCTHVITGWFS